MEFDPDLGMHDCHIGAENLVVPYDDFISGHAAGWPAIPLVNSSFSNSTTIAASTTDITDGDVSSKPIGR